MYESHQEKGIGLFNMTRLINYFAGTFSIDGVPGLGTDNTNRNSNYKNTEERTGDRVMQIVLVDDHPLVRKGLTSILSLEATMDVSGEATNSKEALTLFHTAKPDLAIVDLRLANDSGLDLIQEAKQQGITCKFVVLTSSTEERDFQRAKEISVDGYVLKEALPEELIHALQIVSRGRKYYDPGVLDLLMTSQEIPFEIDGQIEQLTPKEKEVLLELGMGLSNKQISQTLIHYRIYCKKTRQSGFSKARTCRQDKRRIVCKCEGISDVQCELRDMLIHLCKLDCCH